MSDGLGIALVTAMGGAIPALAGAIWAVFRFFLDREDRLKERLARETRETVAAKDREIGELREQVRELERALWQIDRR